MILVLVTTLILSTTTIEVDSYRLVSTTSNVRDIDSTRLTLIKKNGAKAREYQARIYGVEPFSETERSLINHNYRKFQTSFESSRARKGCGEMEPWGLLKLGEFLQTNQPIQFSLVGKDSDGTLVIDLEMSNGSKLSERLLSAGSLKGDPRIVALDSKMLKLVDEARREKRGIWRWLSYIEPKI